MAGEVSVVLVVELEAAEQVRLPNSPHRNILCRNTPHRNSSCQVQGDRSPITVGVDDGVDAVLGVGQITVIDRRRPQTI